MEILLQNLRTLRRLKGWKQQDMAIRLDMSVPAFSKLENGKTDIKLSKLDQISEAFDIPVAKLLKYSYVDIQDHAAREERINQKLDSHGANVVQLQKTIIELYEELEDFDTN